jgi:putative membrane protein
MAIVGLTEYEMLRDFLYSKMRGARFGDPSDDEQKDAAASPGAEPADETLELLTDIRDEIRTLREQLGRPGS